MNTVVKWMVLITGLVLLTSACSGIGVSQDYAARVAFNQYKTYDWAQTPAETKTDLKTDNPLVMDRINEALVKTLTEKGWTRDKVSPQCRIAFHYTVETKLTSSSSGPMFGIALGGGRGGTAMALGTSTGIEQYDQGLVTIDMVDSKTGKLVWQGKGTFRVASQLKPEKMTDKINLTVKKIMDQFPPKGYEEKP